MELNISDSVRDKLQKVLDWTQRELIVERMIPGPFSARFDIDDVLPHCAGKTYSNHRGTVIYAAAYSIHKTWASRDGVRERAIQSFDSLIAGLEGGLKCVADPRTQAYAVTADTVGRDLYGFNEEPAVRTVGLKADLDSVDVAALERQLEIARQIKAKLIERRPPTLAAKLKSARAIGPISCFCYELYKLDQNGRHLLSLEDVATIVGELRAGDSEELRAAALDRVLRRYIAVREKVEN